MNDRAALALAVGLVLLGALGLAWWTGTGRPTPPPASKPDAESAPASDDLDEIAERYVQLALAVGRYDEDYVDAYFGPEALREASLEIRRERIAAEGRRLVRALDALPEGAADRMVAMRRASLRAHLEALVVVMERLDGNALPFEDEVRLVYDVEAPRFDAETNAAALAELERLLPGEGDLAVRHAAWTARFELPFQVWHEVLRAALEECRRRTLAFIELPAGEAVDIEYVRGKPWGAFNEYHGGYRSVVQVNLDGLLTMDSALVFACHEAYPGHHVQNVLLEQRLVNERGWVEFSVHPLYAPSAVLAEGTACVALSVIFPAEERDDFLAETLFPLADLAPEDAATYGRISDLVDRLGRARTEAARRRFAPDGSRLRAARWLEQHSFLSRSGAYGQLGFAEHYGSYVVTYTVGADLVRAWLAANARPGGPSAQALFADLLRRPYLPRDLRAPALR